MSVTVIERGPKLQAQCGRCKSVLEFEAKDAGYQRLSCRMQDRGGFFRIECPVCGAEVRKGSQ